MSVFFLQLMFFLCSFFISFYRLSWGAFLCAATVGWWELPSLILGYPNQFLIDLILLGFVARSSLYFIKQPKQFSHPFLIPLFIACLGLFASHLGWLLEKIVWSASGFNFFDYLGMLSRHLWFWDIGFNPVHDIYLLVSYGIQIAWIMTCLALIKQSLLSKQSLLQAFVFGSLPIFIWAILQATNNVFFYPHLSQGVSGSFQNPNHLGFYSGVILIFSYYGFVFLNQKKYLLPFILAAAGCYLGESRTAWFALMLAFVVAYLFKNKQIAIFYILKFISERKVFFITCVLIIFSGWLEYNRGQMDFRPFISEGLRFFSLPENRLNQYVLSIYTALFYPLTGLGAGLFFRKVPVGFEEHSLLLWSFNSFGLPLTFIACFYFIRQVLRLIVAQSKANERWLALMISVYVIICLLPDHYFSYHSLLATSSLAFILMVPEGCFAPVSIKKRYRFANRAFAFCLCLLPIFFRHSSEVPTKVYPYEPSMETTSHFVRWTGPLISYEVPAASCVVFQIKSVSQKKRTPILLGVLPKDFRGKLPSFANLSDHLFYAQQWSRQKQFLKENTWQNVCLCDQNQAPAPSKTIFMMSMYGDYLSLSPDHRSTDDRFLSFQVSKERILGPSSDEHLECDVAYY